VFVSHKTTDLLGGQKVKHHKVNIITVYVSHPWTWLCCTIRINRVRRPWMKILSYHCTQLSSHPLSNSAEQLYHFRASDATLTCSTPPLSFAPFVLFSLVFFPSPVLLPLKSFHFRIYFHPSIHFSPVLGWIPIKRCYMQLSHITLKSGK